jgi:hypothetical protein
MSQTRRTLSLVQGEVPRGGLPPAEVCGAAAGNHLGEPVSRSGVRSATRLKVVVTVRMGTFQ